MKSAVFTLNIEHELREMNEALLISSLHQHELTEQAQNAEAALRDSEQRFRTLFELGPVAVYSCDASGVIQQFNRRAAELWGRAPALGDTDERFCGSFRMIRPDGSVLAHEQCPMAEVLRGTIPHARDAEVRIDRPDGSRITVVVNIRPLKNEQGKITGAINCFYDVTERKQAESLIQCQMELLEMLVKGEPIERVLDFLARSMESQSQGQFLVAIHLMEPDGYHFGHVAAPSLPPSYAQATRGMDARLEMGPCSSAVVSHEPTVVRDFAAQGRWPTFSAEVVSLGLRGCFTTPILSSDQKVLGTFAIYYHEPRVPSPHDQQLVDLVTSTVAIAIERKQAEGVTARLAAIVASSDDAIISKDLDGVISSWNRGAEHLFGYTAEEVIGKSVSLLIPDDHLNEEPTILSRIRRGESVEHYETVRRRKDGNRLDISLTVSPIKNNVGQVIGASKIARNITERKRAEEQLRLAKREADAANRAKDMFLATLSHEMRTPLSAIVGWMQILQGGMEGGCSDAELDEGLDVVERNARTMVQLLDDVLDVARIVSGKLRLEVRPCELSAVIRAGIDVVRPAASAKGIALSAQLDPAASPVSCDAARMQQVVWNLLSNAIKFTPKGGKVHVTLAREGSDVRIQVSDSGQGIGPELLPYVFDRFRQADSSTRRRFAGLGLGLSIVKHLVELHGGTVHAHSEGEGQGSTFSVLLPVRAVRMDESGDELGAENESEHSVSTALPLVRLDGLRVLVVDDEPDARRLLVKVLQQAGAVVTAAASAAEAIEALAGPNPDILVSDLGMPDEDGFDLIRQIRARGHHAKDLPAVALTAFVHKNDGRQALLAGFQLHIPKPADPHDLTAAIASLAGRTGPTA